MRASTWACSAVDACMGPSACFGLLFLQLVLCAFLICSCVCPMIGASLSSFICIEVLLCSKSNWSSGRFGPVDSGAKPRICHRRCGSGPKEMMGRRLQPSIDAVLDGVGVARRCDCASPEEKNPNHCREIAVTGFDCFRALLG